MCVSLIKTGDCVCVCARVCVGLAESENEKRLFPPREQQRLPATWLMQTSIYSLLLLLSEAAQRTHMEKREKKRREQSDRVHSHNITHTPHAHHVWSQWAAEVYWSFQQEEEEWKQENSSEVMKQGHCFSCINVFCVFDLLEVTGIFHDLCCQEALTFDLCTIVECRVKINEVLWPRGFILRTHADFNMWEFKKHDMIVAVVVLTLLSWLLTGRRTTPCLILSIISFTAFDFTSSTPSAARERILLYILHI